MDLINGKTLEARGDEMGVVVEFTLGSSMYATMAMRELTRSETGSGYQAQMSHKADATRAGEKTEAGIVGETIEVEVAEKRKAEEELCNGTKR